MLFKVIGFGIGLLTLGVILYFLFNGILQEQLVIVAFLFGLNVLIGFVLPKIFKKNKILKELKNGSALFAKKMNDFVVAIVLSIVYIIGVGPTWVLSRILGKKFLQLHTKTKMWHKTAAKSDLKEMF
jgi:hypothetical protein